jgi:2-amino-4-hydroxy-6-hydroxymethyldihydropteridine diphosphokinase
MPPPESRLAAVGLGSNLDNPAAQLQRAIEELSALPRSMLQARSPLYRSVAIGQNGRSVPQPDFCNAAVLLETRLPARELLKKMHALEIAHGRRRAARGAARCLDLDLLLYGDQVLREPGMTVPHPRLAERNFVLYPLRDIAPEIVVPGLGPVRALAARLGPEGLRLWRD